MLETQQGNSILRAWLKLMCFAIILMIFIGGLTRLKDSGLSITEWNPVSGVLPPYNNDLWDIEFEKYKHSPEYIKHNMGMTIDEFKPIYLLEFFHRLAGRITFLLYIIPLIIFSFIGFIKKGELKIYIFALFLLVMQGVAGWYMVKSGLISTPYVSHYRLALHLILAIFLYITIFWQLMKNSCDIILMSPEPVINKLSFWCLLSIFILLIQIILGAFVAGLKAGYVYNDFPMMGDYFIPHEIYKMSFNIDILSEPIFIQFIHRITAYLLLIVICIFYAYGIYLQNKKFLRIMNFVMFAVILQVILGIATLLSNVTIELALMHQLGAVILLSYLLKACFVLHHNRNDRSLVK